MTVRAGAGPTSESFDHPNPLDDRIDVLEAGGGGGGGELDAATFAPLIITDLDDHELCAVTFDAPASGFVMVELGLGLGSDTAQQVGVNVYNDDLSESYCGGRQVFSAELADGSTLPFFAVMRVPVSPGTHTWHLRVAQTASPAGNLLVTGPTYGGPGAPDGYLRVSST